MEKPTAMAMANMGGHPKNKGYLIFRIDHRVYALAIARVADRRHVSRP